MPLAMPLGYLTGTTTYGFLCNGKEVREGKGREGAHRHGAPASRLTSGSCSGWRTVEAWRAMKRDETRYSDNARRRRPIAPHRLPTQRRRTMYG